ncbi:50S ribosomal protein L2 [Dissostichus eleginoides]|uniref:50S ribosomal protein L2 n=1 Tax=Dissostichus eleginoides TaxID=100907 RepID=A0AAD9F8V4_DISEL|nr:50S ribosomal protein L2 [Dissostichus eleginoides]
MTKTGKPDGCWAGIMHQYAQGKHRFSTGQRPKSKKWRSVIQRIDACPLTPIFNLPLRYIDIFGRRILCKCGYHVNTRCDSRGVEGWEAVDDLAKYLVQLNRTITALSVGETDEIVRLYSKLHQMDKQPNL